MGIGVRSKYSPPLWMIILKHPRCIHIERYQATYKIRANLHYKATITN